MIDIETQGQPLIISSQPVGAAIGLTVLVSKFALPISLEKLNNGTHNWRTCA